jgi:hypothetical protein
VRPILCRPATEWHSSAKGSMRSGSARAVPADFGWRVGQVRPVRAGRVIPGLLSDRAKAGCSSSTRWPTGSSARPRQRLLPPAQSSISRGHRCWGRSRGSSLPSSSHGMHAEPGGLTGRVQGWPEERSVWWSSPRVSARFAVARPRLRDARCGQRRRAGRAAAGCRVTVRRAGRSSGGASAKR